MLVKSTLLLESLSNCLEALFFSGVRLVDTCPVFDLGAVLLYRGSTICEAHGHSLFISTTVDFIALVLYWRMLPMTVVTAES